MDRGSDGQDAEAGDSFELGRVGGRDFHAMTYGGRRDPHVVRTDHFTVTLQSRPDFGMSPGDRGRDRQWLNRGDHVLDESLSPGANVAVRGAVNAVEQLAGRDHTDRTLSLAKGILERRATPLHIDQDRGVDQDGHAALGGPMSSRPASTSFSKLSSTAGAPSISSRQRSADTT